MEGHDWDGLDQRYQTGMIDNPRNKDESIRSLKKAW